MQAMEQMYESDLTSLDMVFRESLTQRRGRLQEAIAARGAAPEFAGLLDQVDAALAKLDRGTFGKCEACEGYVETDRLLADPLVRFCLGDLSDAERQNLEYDLQLASTIQRGLLPQVTPGHASWKTHFIYEPLGPVSGDYCDVIPHGEDLFFIIGDVSGKGMAASLLMSSLRAIFHTLVPLNLELSELMSRANHLLVEGSPASQFATLICGRANARGEIEIANAGHLPPIVIKNGAKEEFNIAGLPLGMFTDARFPVGRINLSGGDSIILFTDGVTEAVDSDGTEYGTSRLIESLNGSIEPSELISCCLNSLTNFRGSNGRQDDLTMLALTFSGNPA
jgi:sigma-B regulation protein RsbU (phosphoserine phosphatase)